MKEDFNWQVLHICGPTASGKTWLAHTLFDTAPKVFKGIINCDSRQFFKEMSVATAKPSIAELKKYAYHFCNHLNISDSVSAYSWGEDMLALLRQDRQKRYLAVGGPSLYSSFFHYKLPKSTQETAQKAQEINLDYVQLYEKKGLGSLQAHLKKADIECYNTIDIKNPRRVIRALVQIAVYGKKASEIRSQRKKSNIRVVTWYLVPSRKKLYAQIDRRVDNMVKAGLLVEARQLLNNNADRVLKIGAIGYEGIFSHLRGRASLDEALALMKQKTRQLAKRQMTWIKQEHRKQLQSKKLEEAKSNEKGEQFFKTGSHFFLLGEKKNPDKPPSEAQKVLEKEDYFGLERLKKDNSIHFLHSLKQFSNEAITFSLQNNISNCI